MVFTMRIVIKIGTSTLAHHTGRLNIRRTEVLCKVISDLKNAGHDFSIDDGFNLLKLHVKEAENDGALRYIASTYDPYDQIIRDGLYPGGRKVITFANILQHDVFPFPA